MSRVRLQASWWAHWFGIAFVALALTACAYPIRAKHDADPTVDLASYRTYAWIPQDPSDPAAGVRHGGYVSSLDEQRIVRAVDDELAAKGYRRVEAIGSADLAVTFWIGVQEKTRVNQYPVGTIKSTRDHGYGKWYSNSAVVVRTHEEGTLALELYDRATKQAVWAGWAQKRLEEHRDDSEQVIRKAVVAVLAQLPDRP